MLDSDKFAVNDMCFRQEPELWKFEAVHFQIAFSVVVCDF